MNATRNLKIDFRINGVHDHYINDPKTRHVQPHQPKSHATKPWKQVHPKKEEVSE